MTPGERRALALRQIQTQGLCEIDELANLLDVSRVTVHRILDELESQGLVRKERGGVRANGDAGAAGRFEQRKSIDAGLKREIAARALEFIGERDAIFLDASTTAYFFADALASSVPNNLLTIVTNSPAIVWRLLGMSAYHVISTGGELDHRLASLTGPITQENLSALQISKAFISPNAVSPQGIMTPHSSTAALLSKLLEKNVETTLLAESPKFGRLAPLFIAPLSKLRRIITDTRLSPEIRKQYEDAGIEIL